MPRAGLIFLVFLFSFIGLVACAPLPERLLSLVERSGNHKDDLLAQSFNVILRREYDHAGPAFYTKRDYPLFLKSRDFDLGYWSQYSGKDESYDSDNIDEGDFNEEEYGHYTKRDEYEVRPLSRRSFWSKIGSAFKKGFSKVKQTFQKAGNAIKASNNRIQQAFRKAGNQMRGGFVNMGHKMNQGFQKVAQAGKKVGTFFKQNGLKIAKVGLKFIAAGATAAGKIVKFIPGVGTAVGMALKGIAMGANIGSEQIHANLGGTLGKITDGLDYVISPIGTGAKKLGAPGAKDIVADIFTRGFLKLN